MVGRLSLSLATWTSSVRLSDVNIRFTSLGFVFSEKVSVGLYPF